MKRKHRCVVIRILGCALLFLAACAVRSDAGSVLYDDGVWRVDGIDEVGPSLNRIDVSVAGQPSGSFTELRVFLSFSGGFQLIYSIQGDGGLTPVLPPSGDLGGTFHLTGYWDCYAGQRPDVRIITLNIAPNTSNFTSLNFTGTVSNGTSLQAPDLSLKLQMPDEDTVNLGVKYTLYATSDVCVDQWHQEFAEGFQVVRMASSYISNQVHDNDGARVKGIVGKDCDCCSCDKITGSICASFINDTGYLYVNPVRMAESSVLMVHSQPGPLNTPALKIVAKKPGYGQSKVQGYTVFSTDPTTDNVNLWVNWNKAKKQYAAGKKVGVFQFNLIATLPEPKSCDFISQ